VLLDNTVQEKSISCPTDSKLANSVIDRLNQLAKRQGIQQRRTFIKKVKTLQLACCHFRHVKRRGTIAHHYRYFIAPTQKNIA